jgi:hypothetical protein
VAAGVPAACAWAAAEPGPEAPAVSLWQESVDGGKTVVATFHTGKCRLEPSVVGSGQRLIATATDDRYRLQVYIDPFAGFQHYDVRYESTDPLLIVRGPGGPFSNMNYPVRLPAQPVGAIDFSPHGARLRLHFEDAFNKKGTDDVLLSGVMTCRLPPPPPKCPPPPPPPPPP